MQTKFASRALMCMCLGLALSAAAVAHEPKESPQPSMPMTGNVDKDFAAMMTMHHQMAIDMVDIYAKKGHNAKLKAMAMKMKAAQQAEIKQMAAFK